VCNKAFKYLTAHLKTANGKTKKEALQISAANRAVKEGLVQKRTALPFPVQGCYKMVARVDLRRVHKLNNDDPEYRRLSD
jgi:hypothetical protein